MTGSGSIINFVAMLTVITKMDMMIIMVGTTSIINLVGILTGITKNGMDIIIAGTKNIINAAIITVIDIVIGKFTGATLIIIITTIIMRYMKGPLSDSN